MKALLLSGGRVIAPANGIDTVSDVLTVGGRIAAVGPEAGRQAPPDATRVDVKGLVVCPGLIDVHVHLREPGPTAQETNAPRPGAARLARQGAARRRPAPPRRGGVPSRRWHPQPPAHVRLLGVWAELAQVH